MNFIFSLLGNIGGQIYIYIALVFSSFGAGFYVEHLRFADYKNEVAIVAEKQVAENKAKEKEQQLVNKGVEDAYKANLSNVHNFYSGMLYTNSGAMSSDVNATITINGQTHNILSLAEQCASTTEQVIALQDWINQQVGLDAK
jgi:hypothetical protein